MNNKKILIVTFIVIFAFAAYSSLRAEKAENQTMASSFGSKIAIVSIKTIFQKSTRNEQYQKQAVDQQNNFVSELEKLQAQIQADQAGLKTLKPQSQDYLDQAEKLFTKKGEYQAKKEFYKQQLELKDKNWTEKFYQDIVSQIGIIAKELNIDMVLEKDQLELPAPDTNELMLIIRTNKVLYSKDELDITQKVIDRVDALE